MKFKIVHIMILALFIIIIAIVIGSYAVVKTDNFNIGIFNKNRLNESTNNTSIVTPMPTIDYNSTLYLPSNDYVINHINWSNYPSLQQGYVHDAKITEPTGTDSENGVTHSYIISFIYIEINTDDQSKVVNEMKGVARDARSIYGPNSEVFIIANKNGVFYNNVNTYPYDDNIYGGSIY
jgi:hypothetical protein